MQNSVSNAVPNAGSRFLSQARGIIPCLHAKTALRADLGQSAGAGIPSISERTSPEFHAGADGSAGRYSAENLLSQPLTASNNP
jgi:hypothetical protein